MRLIDADAFIESIPNFDLPEDTIDACSLRIHLINAPTIDPVKYLQNRGYIVTKPLQIQLYKCPHCGMQTPIKTEYCQQCFGKMDQEANR